MIMKMVVDGNSVSEQSALVLYKHALFLLLLLLLLQSY